VKNGLESPDLDLGKRQVLTGVYQGPRAQISVDRTEGDHIKPYQLQITRGWKITELDVFSGACLRYLGLPNHTAKEEPASWSRELQASSDAIARRWDSSKQAFH
jgi:hypothetical protein